MLDPGSPTLPADLPERIEWAVDAGAGCAAPLEVPGLERWRLPLAPMIGCFGVAPERQQAISAATSDRHGGNMDWNGFRAGVTALFPVFEPGALFSLGDVHAVQGDGEIVGTGIEISADVVFRVELLKGRAIGWPRAQSPAFIAALGNARPLDQCVQHATTEMLRWAGGGLRPRPPLGPRRPRPGRRLPARQHVRPRLHHGLHPRQAGTQCHHLRRLNPQRAQTAACKPPSLWCYAAIDPRSFRGTKHMPSEKSLHLPQLAISGFRGINELLIPRLGRVTLLAGKNSVGKTTVLDAVRVYASRGRYSVLRDLLRDRQELTESTDQDGDISVDLDWMSLFHGRYSKVQGEIIIGPNDAEYHLEIHAADTSLHHADPTVTIKPIFRNKEDKMPPSMTCEYLGPGRLNEGQMSHLWDSVALTDDENRVRNALDLVIGTDVVGVAIVGESRSVRGARRAIVRLKSQDHPVPLKSLGDGAVRLFGVALALANSRGGFLLIDEAENGIHHTVQRALWTMILRAAHENDVQVLATTHSWDCVRGFAQAATDFEHGEGVLVRLERDNGELRAIEYSEEDLRIAAEHGIEVR